MFHSPKGAGSFRALPIKTPPRGGVLIGDSKMQLGMCLNALSQKFVEIICIGQDLTRRHENLDWIFAAVKLTIVEKKYLSEIRNAYD
jgi:hypothetical protein